MDVIPPRLIPCFMWPRRVCQAVCLTDSAEDAGAIGVEERLQGDLGWDADAGDVDLEGACGEGGSGDAVVAADAGDAAGGAEGVAEAAAADVADGSAVPVDRFVADEVVVGGLEQDVDQTTGQRARLLLLE